MRTRTLHFWLGTYVLALAVILIVHTSAYRARYDTPTQMITADNISDLTILTKLNLDDGRRPLFMNNEMYFMRNNRVDVYNVSNGAWQGSLNLAPQDASYTMQQFPTFCLASFTPVQAVQSPDAQRYFVTVNYQENCESSLYETNTYILEWDTATNTRTDHRVAATNVAGLLPGTSLLLSRGFNPDGLYALDLDDFSSRQLDNVRVAGWFHFGPTYVYYQTTDGTLMRLDADLTVTTIAEDMGTIWLMSPNDTLVLHEVMDNLMISTRDGVLQWQLPPTIATIGPSVSFSHNSELLAASHYTGQVSLLDARTGNRLEIMHESDNLGVWQLLFTWDSRAVIGVRAGEVVGWSLNGDEQVRLRIPDNVRNDAYFSPDGRLLVTDNGTIMGIK